MYHCSVNVGWHRGWACFGEFFIPGQFSFSSPLCVQRAGFGERGQMSGWQLLTSVSHRSPGTSDTSLEWKRGFQPFPHKVAASFQGITPCTRQEGLDIWVFPFCAVYERNSWQLCSFLELADQHQARDWMGFINFLLCLLWKLWIVLKLWIALKLCCYYCDSS